ncbi:Integrase [Spirosomataceae bacterium TFI 002]|nr:Integrase [Spirosomataceae bacterium TFI 002]
MATINYLIQSEKNPSAIHLRFKDGKIDVKSKTGLFVDPSNWSKAKQKPKVTKSAETKALAFELESLKVKILNEYNKLQIDHGKIDSNWIKKIIHTDENTQSGEGLLEYFEHYIRVKRSELSKRGLQKIINLRNTIEEFQNWSKSTYEVSDVGLSFQDSFLEFLSNEKLYRQTTKHRVIKFLKTVCRNARIDGYATSPQLDSLGVKDGKVNIIYLSEEEIVKIKNTQLDQPFLENAKKWLLLSCYLGQRGGDLLKCTLKDVIENKGQKLLDMNQEKSGNPIYVLVLPEADEILSLNNGNFPRKISLQKYNEYIKEVARLAGLTEVIYGTKIVKESGRKIDGFYPKWELVTSHIGRRSYCTNYYGKLPTPLLMKQTGHKSEAMFLKYIGKSSIESMHDLARAHSELKK